LVKRIEGEDEQVRVVYRVSPPPFVESPRGGVLSDRVGRGGSPVV